jgi:PTS system cellobiose-specific IIC component
VSLDVDKVTCTVAKLGNYPCARAIREGSGVSTPLFLAMGVVVLVCDAFDGAWAWGRVLGMSVFGIMGLILAATFSYTLTKAKDAGNPLLAAVCSVICFVVSLPYAEGGASALTSPLVGVDGAVAGAIVGLVVSELMAAVSRTRVCRLDLPEGVPPAVSGAIAAIVPSFVSLVAFGLASIGLSMVGTSLVGILSTWVQGPLVAINTSLVGCAVILILSNLLFCFGIHQSVVSGVLLEPLLLLNMCRDMSQVLAGNAVTEVMNMGLVSSFALIGGSGSTLCLILATLLFCRRDEWRECARDAIRPGAFNINEPVIFGYPIVGDRLLMVPFVVAPVVGLCIGYAATVAGVMPVFSAYMTWVCPPLLDAFLGTGGSLVAVGVQLLAVVACTLLYLPFLVAASRRA